MRAFPMLFILALVAGFSGCTNGPFAKGDNTEPGQRAGDYLRASPYASVVVELHAVGGAAPEGDAMNALQARLHSATGKPVQIVQGSDVQGQGSGHKYTFDEIAAIEGRARQQYSSGAQAVLFMLYIDGGSSSDSGGATVLGAAYRGSSVVMFKQNIRDASCGSNCVSLPGGLGNTKPTPAAIETSVITHEAGHILGLVNNGVAMQSPHEDGQHLKHSTNQQSVMYWAVESNSIGSVFGQTPPNDFDANDNADLRAARGSGA